MPNTAYILDAVRTPRSKGKPDGSLHGVKPVALGAGLLRGLQARHDLDTSRVDDVVMGCVTPVDEQGACIPKTIALYAGWDEAVPGVQLDRFCASGLEAVNIAAMKVASGWESLVLAGGIESMSRVPMGSNGGAVLSDPDVRDRLKMVGQGVAADAIAKQGGWSREDMDALALQSQRRAANAQANGYFDRSVLPVIGEDGTMILEKDDFIKPGTTLEGLAKLKPSFEMMGASGQNDVVLSKYPELRTIEHVHTPGNSSGIVDGASAVLIGSELIAGELGIQPRARIVATAVTANDPTLMLIGPGPAAKKVLAKAGLTVADIDLFEINEAFASVMARFMQDLGITSEVTNVNGGAIAMGHALGATGAMLIGIVLDELERRDLKRGLVALCAGSGMGIATIIERV